MVDTTMEKKDEDPKMVRAGDILINYISMCGFVHNGFNTIRLKEAKQTINPSYDDGFTPKPQEKDICNFPVCFVVRVYH